MKNKYLLNKIYSIDLGKKLRFIVHYNKVNSIKRAITYGYIESTQIRRAKTSASGS